MDAKQLEAWIGRERESEDFVSLHRARALAATLDLDPTALSDGSPLPPAWHWIYFHAAAPRSELAEDGHALKGSFLPPLELPRRMWAGGEILLPGTLRIGEPARRVSTIRSIVPKDGRAGPLVFVTVEHRISGGNGLAIVEEQSLVYLERRHAASDASDPRGGTESDRSSRVRTTIEGVGRAPDWTEPFVADEVVLFRFSALTLNSHRIHYDQRYSTEVEGYPGIVVHGPLLALLLMNAGVQRLAGGEGASDPEGATGPPAQVALDPGLRFQYRAVQPLFCNERFDLCARRVEHEGDAAGDASLVLWASHAERGVVTEARLTPPALDAPGA